MPVQPNNQQPNNQQPTTRLLNLAAALLLVLVALPAAAPAATPATVARFTPQGTVKGIRQARARFSEPDGGARRSARRRPPFRVDCREAGSGRWLDSSDWVYDFERDLPAGVRCTFRLREDLRSLAGNAVGGQTTFSFSTGGPAIISSMPARGSSSIEEEQAFVLALDGTPDEQSVLDHAAFSVDGVAERIGVRLRGEGQGRHDPGGAAEVGAP